MAGEPGVRVVVCDDHRAVREVCRITLELAGAEVHEAGDGRQCLDVAKRVAAHAVLLDVQMPRSGGLDVLAQFTRELPNTRVYVMSVETPPERHEEAMRLGAAGVLNKTQLFVALRDLVDEIRHSL